MLGCRYICKSVLTEADIIRGDSLLLKFCKEFETLYGKKAVTPKMHLHCHLKENVLDYGPIHSFWCFSFERYNGILCSITTNYRSLELQLMRKLNISQALSNNCFPPDGCESFQQLINSMRHQTEDFQESKPELVEYYHMDSKLSYHSNNWDNISAIEIPSRHKERSLDNDDINALTEVYQVMFPSSNIIPSNLSRTMKVFTCCLIFGLRYGSRKEYRNQRTAGILASWPHIDGKVNQTTLSMAFGTVQFYFSHSLLKEGEHKNYFFACVTWYNTSDDRFTMALIHYWF